MVVRDLAGNTPLVIGVVGGEKSLNRDDFERISAQVSDLIARLKGRLPNTPLTLLTMLNSADCIVAADVAVEQGCVVWAPAEALTAAGRRDSEGFRALPQAFWSAEADPEDRNCPGQTLCRYAHLLLHLDHGVGDLEAGDSVILRQWIEGRFAYGDDPQDDERLILLRGPESGPVGRVDVSAPLSALKLAWWRRGGGLVSALGGEARDAGSPASRASAHRALEVWREIDVVNRRLAAVPASAAAERTENFLSAAKLGAIGVGGGFDPDGFGYTRERFGRASWRARRAKKVTDAYNYIYAFTPTLAVVGYEVARQALPVASSMPLSLYVIVFAAFLTIGMVLATLRTHERLLEFRVLAEMLRAQTFWRLGGVSARLETTLRRWLPGASDVMEALCRSIDFQMAVAGPVRAPMPYEAARQWIDSQLRWHGSSSESHYANSRTLERSQFLAFLFAFLIAVGLLALAWIPNAPKHVSTGFIEALAISGLPALAGAFAIIRERFSYRVLADSYTRMFRLSEAASVKLESWRSDSPKIRQLLDEFGRETIRESIEWMLTHRMRRIDPRGI